MDDLFANDRRMIELSPGAMLLGGYAIECAPALLAGIAAVSSQAPFRNLETSGGRRMSVAMTNAGGLGWVSDRRGYRYERLDPDSGRPWPAIPAEFEELAAHAAAAAGYEGFAPEACLINRYEPGTRLTLHQDKDERNLDQPIVSVSLGVDAVFLWGGATRGERPRRIALSHGDIVVWGGPSRLAFHGIDAVPQSGHPDTGHLRFNLTFRTVG